ncbi:MAG: hypothetical protein INR65_01340 [Gluconacetobacter diazotrophicus]|nr:hypothetical protein [Gluconacetobacter diazotrophicus]
MSRRLAAAVLALLVAPALPAAIPSASAAVPAPCDRTVITLPVIGTDGAVVVPVSIDGVPAAAEIEPRAYPSFVSDPAGLTLPRLGRAGTEALAGSERGDETAIDLQLGDATMAGLHAVVLDEPPRPPVAGRRVAMVLGANLLDGYQVLLDLPNRRLTLFGPGGSSCPDPAAAIPGRPVAVTLREGEGGTGQGGRIDVVDAVLDGFSLPMEISLGSNDTIVRRAVARRLGVTGAMLEADPQVRTRSAAVRVGWRHEFNSLSIGAYTVSRPRIDVQRDLNYDALGLDLFAGKTVLFDFPGRRLVFDPRPPIIDAGRASALSSTQTRNADTAVEQDRLPRS